MTPSVLLLPQRSRCRPSKLPPSVPLELQPSGPRRPSWPNAIASCRCRSRAGRAQCAERAHRPPRYRRGEAPRPWRRPPSRRRAPAAGIDRPARRTLPRLPPRRPPRRRPRAAPRQPRRAAAEAAAKTLPAAIRPARRDARRDLPPGGGERLARRAHRRGRRWRQGDRRLARPSARAPTPGVDRLGATGGLGGARSVVDPDLLGEEDLAVHLDAVGRDRGQFGGDLVGSGLLRCGFFSAAARSAAAAFSAFSAAAFSAAAARSAATRSGRSALSAAAFSAARRLRSALSAAPLLRPRPSPRRCARARRPSPRRCAPARRALGSACSAAARSAADAIARASSAASARLGRAAACSAAARSAAACSAAACSAAAAPAAAAAARFTGVTRRRLEGTERAGRTRRPSGDAARPRRRRRADRAALSTSWRCFHAISPPRTASSAASVGSVMTCRPRAASSTRPSECRRALGGLLSMWNAPRCHSTSFSSLRTLAPNEYAYSSAWRKKYAAMSALLRRTCQISAN